MLKLSAPRCVMINVRAVVSVLIFGALNACGGDSSDSDRAKGSSTAGRTQSYTYAPQSRFGQHKITINSVSLDKVSSVQFVVVDQGNRPVTGLTVSNVQISLARLFTGRGGQPDQWRSYLNTIEAPNGEGPGTEAATQAGIDDGGTLSEPAPGQYLYQFGVDIKNVSEPLNVQFDPSTMHRLGLQVRTTGIVDGYETLVAGNATYTWYPDNPGKTTFTWKDAVDNRTCNGCHQALGTHQKTRFDTRLCVTCHTADSVDADSGNSLDFNVLIHKIHRGAHLPSVAKGGEFSIWGEDDQKSDFSTVRFPQDIRNCSACHVDDSASRINRPNPAACSSCHDNVNFATGEGHATGIVATSQECAICHRESGVAGSVAMSHTAPEKRLANAFAFRILGIDNTSPGEFPTITFEVVNPDHGDEPYDLRTHDAWTTSPLSKLDIYLGWGAGEFHNTGSGVIPGQPIQINALTHSSPNGDGSYSVTSAAAIPANASGSGMAGIAGRAAVDFDQDGVLTDKLAIKSVVKYFPISDASPKPRRQVVDVRLCDSCHERLSVHDKTRTDEPQLCVMCHNPNATDIATRPANAGDTPDGKKEEAIDFKTMIHNIHDAQHNKLPTSVTDYIIPPPGPLKPRPDFIVYGADGQPHHFGDVRYPGVLGNCAACHTKGSYILPLASEVLATTTDTGADLSDPNDDTNTTKTKAACLSCHYWQGDHMDAEGLSSSHARYPLVDAGIALEQCHNCHGPGGMADIEVMHPIIEK